MTTLVRAIAALGMLFAAWLLGDLRKGDETARAPMVRQALEYPWLTAGLLATGALVIAAFVVISGVVPIGASSGHWAITAALLDFAKIRSVSTYSLSITAPPLDDHALVLKGAGHYETVCVQCHGGPGRSIPPALGAMTPAPPDLTERLARWAPEELFSIVKHGIKFTGMPAWPAQQRDDEVWAMTAFLRRMPALDAAGYRRLVYGDPDRAEAPPELPVAGSQPAPRAVREVCWRCHGVDGTGRGGAFPSLAGQRAAYVYGTLRAFRARHRFSGIMGAIATRLDDGAMREIASYFESLPARRPDPPEDHASIARGRAIATRGIPEREIPVCVECHGPAAAPKNPAYPRLAAQHSGYLAAQLGLLQQHQRGGTGNVNLMREFVDRLRQDEIRDVAVYFSTLPADGDRPATASR